MPTAHDVRDLDPEDLDAAIKARRLDYASDAGLIDAVAAVLAEPRADTPDSFILHAPLELLARAALLPWVSPDQRSAARRQILRIAAEFEASGPPVEAVPMPFPDPHDAIDALFGAMATGDLAGAGAAGQHLGRTLDAPALVAAVAARVAPSLSAAAHGPIFLHQLPRAAPSSPMAGAMFGTLAREVARHPDWLLRWFETTAPTPAPAGLTRALAATPVTGPVGSMFIQPLMRHAEASGVAAEVVGPTLGDDMDLVDATRAVLRTAAASMLLDDPAHAPYGWSHCLTIPQGVLSAAAMARSDPRAMVAIAATHVVGFRTALGSAPLDTLTGPLGRVGADGLLSSLAPMTAARLQAVIDHAGGHEDAHLAKYVVSCIDASRTDPAGAAQYLHAAAYLSDWWRRSDG